MSVTFSWDCESGGDSPIGSRQFTAESIDAKRPCIYVLFNLKSSDQVPDWVNDYYIASDENHFCEAHVTGAPEATKVQSNFKVKTTNFSNARAVLHDDASIKAVQKNAADDIYVVSGGFHVTNETKWIIQPGGCIVMWESQ